MIDGMRIDVTAEEPTRHLDERTRHHHDRAAESENKAKQAEGLESAIADDDEPLISYWPGYRHELERKAARHRNREALLVFLRNHIVAHEIYRLGERDLNAVELLPAEEGLRAF